MDIELLHESMNAVPAVMRVVQAIDPISHAPISPGCGGIVHHTLGSVGR